MSFFFLLLVIVGFSFSYSGGHERHVLCASGLSLDFPPECITAPDIDAHVQSWNQMDMLNETELGAAFMQATIANGTSFTEPQLFHSYGVSAMQPPCHVDNNNFNPWTSAGMPPSQGPVPFDSVTSQSQFMMSAGMLPCQNPISLAYATGQDQLIIDPGMFRSQDPNSHYATGQDQLPMHSGTLPSQAPTSVVHNDAQNQPTVSAAALGAAPASFACTQPGCQALFKRDTDRIRHEASKHGINGMLHFCQIPGCPKSFGAGYTRKDKLTEHMWRKHADLGFTKRV